MGALNWLECRRTKNVDDGEHIRSQTLIKNRIQSRWRQTKDLKSFIDESSAFTKCGEETSKQRAKTDYFPCSIYVTEPFILSSPLSLIKYLLSTPAPIWAVFYTSDSPDCWIPFLYLKPCMRWYLRLYFINNSRSCCPCTVSNRNRMNGAYQMDIR